MQVFRGFYSFTLESLIIYRLSHLHQIYYGKSTTVIYCGKSTTVVLLLHLVTYYVCRCMKRGNLFLEGVTTSSSIATPFEPLPGRPVPQQLVEQSHQLLCLLSTGKFFSVRKAWTQLKFYHTAITLGTNLIGQKGSERCRVGNKD